MQVQRAVDGLARSGIGQERDNREVRSPRGPALPMTVILRAALLNFANGLRGPRVTKPHFWTSCHGTNPRIWISLSLVVTARGERNAATRWKRATGQGSARE